MNKHTPKYEVQGSAIVELSGISESWNKQIPPSKDYRIVATINQNLDDWESRAYGIIKAVNEREELLDLVKRMQKELARGGLHAFNTSLVMEAEKVLAKAESV